MKTLFRYGKAAILELCNRRGGADKVRSILARYGAKKLSDVPNWWYSMAVCDLEREAFGSSKTQERNEPYAGKTFHGTYDISRILKPKEETTMTLEDALLAFAWTHWQNGLDDSDTGKLRNKATAVLKANYPELERKAKRLLPERVLVYMHTYPDRAPGIISTWNWLVSEYSDGYESRTRMDRRQAEEIVLAFKAGKAAGARGG